MTGRAFEVFSTFTFSSLISVFTSTSFFTSTKLPGGPGGRQLLLDAGPPGLPNGLPIIGGG